MAYCGEDCALSRLQAGDDALEFLGGRWFVIGLAPDVAKVAAHLLRADYIALAVAGLPLVDVLAEVNRSAYEGLDW